jgi:hypothetical protein
MRMMDRAIEVNLYFFYENPKKIAFPKSVDIINPVGKYQIANIY